MRKERSMEHHGDRPKGRAAEAGTGGPADIAGGPDGSFFAEVCDVVAQIPAGKVVTYGQIARLVGRPRHARMVGAALAGIFPELGLPAWRVVNAQGRTVSFWPEQQRLLEREGVRFRAPGRVDMKSALWNPFDEF